MSRTIEPTLNREIREAVQAILDRNEMTEEDAGHLARLLNLVMGPRQEGDVDALKRVALIHRAIRHVRGCFETGEIARLGTVLEDVQPLADAALAYANRKAMAARSATSDEVAAKMKRLNLLETGIAHLKRCLETENRRYANEGIAEVSELNELMLVIDGYTGRAADRARGASTRLAEVEAELSTLRDGVRRALEGADAVGSDPLAQEVKASVQLAHRRFMAFTMRGAELWPYEREDEEGTVPAGCYRKPSGAIAAYGSAHFRPTREDKGKSLREFTADQERIAAELDWAAGARAALTLPFLQPDDPATMEAMRRHSERYARSKAAGGAYAVAADLVATSEQRRAGVLDDVTPWPWRVVQRGVRWTVNGPGRSQKVATVERREDAVFIVQARNASHTSTDR